MLVHLLTAVVLAAPPPPVVVGTTDAPIELDGRLDEPAWQTVEPVTDFVQYRPVDGGPAPGTTEVRFLQDKRNLYVGIVVKDADYEVRARISPREDVNADDQIGIYLDTFHDQRTGYIFYINPRGIQQDSRFNNGSWNGDWNTVFRTKGQVTEDGYILEIAFPWRSLKYRQGGVEQTWGLILTRKTPALGTKYAFPDIDRAHPRMFEQEADLHGVLPPKRGSGVELIPSFTAVQQASRSSLDEDLEYNGLDPWYDALRPSLDMRLGITPNVSLGATLNPDFSQVEGDPTQINLNQRFVFQQTERRPFFLDGSENYQDLADHLYTRSMSQPLYGLRSSGREGPVNLGVLHVLDRSPLASVHEFGTEGFDQQDLLIDPNDADGPSYMAMTTFARTRVDAFGAGYFGVSLADKRILADRGASNELMAVDLVIPIAERWSASGYTSHSLLFNDEGSTWGSRNRVDVSRSGGQDWGWSGWFEDRTADYRNELGYLPQTGVTRAGTSGSYTFEPDGPIDTLTPSVSASIWQERDLGDGNGADHAYTASVSQGISVLGRHSASVTASATQQRQSGFEMLGYGFSGSYSGNWSRTVDIALSGNINRTVDYNADPVVPAWSEYLQGTLTLRPTENLNVSTTLRGQVFDSDVSGSVLAGAVRSRATLQLTKSLGFRYIGEISGVQEADPELLTSVMGAWVLHPGTEAYLGYNEVTLLGEEVGALERTFFAKISGLFRL